MGRRAEQLMKGFMSMVISRLERLSIDRQAMIEGTVQPKPMTSGMNDLPWSPSLCITLSIINAARAI